MAVSVLYGSQTGRAREVAWMVARRLVEEGRRGVGIGSIDGYGLARLREPGSLHACFVFVVSTTGQGDEPDDMKDTWRALKKKSCEPFPPGAVRYAVLALGDSSYEKYNFVGKMLHNRLKQLGAVPITDRGLCDDQDLNGFLDGYLAWIPSLLQAIPQPPDQPTPAAEAKQKFVPRYAVQLLANAGAQAQVGGHSARKHTDVVATVASNTRLTAEAHWQDVREVTFVPRTPGDAARLREELQPAGSLGFLPVNPGASVKRLLRRLNLTGDEVVRVEPNPATNIALLGSEEREPLQATTAELFETVLDVCGTPGRYFFEVLSHAAAEQADADGEQREKLRELASATPEGAEDLRFYCTREKRTFVECLHDFPSVSVSLPWIVDCIPRLQRRQYSAASLPVSPNDPCTPLSGGEARQGSVSIAVAVVEYKTPYGRAKTGLCSAHLAGLRAGDTVFFSVHAPTVSVPPLATPIVLVGPGTGIAPCRTIAQDRAAQLARVLAEGQQAPEAANGVNAHVVFGCRNRDSDFLYRADMSALQPAPYKLGYHVAFSRDQEAKVYVQDVIRSTEALSLAIVSTLLQEDGVLYISGSSKNMPASVQNAVVFCIMKHCAATEEEARGVLEELKKAKRIQFDTWS